MKIKTQLFLVMSIVFTIFMAFMWFYSQALSEKINEKWMERFVHKQILFDKYRTLLPILRETALVEHLSKEPTVIAMALHENDPQIRFEGIKTLERYRIKFQDRSYFTAFAHTGNYYFNDSSNQFSGRQLRYVLSPNQVKDKWFYETIKIGDAFQINVDKDNILGVNKVWIDYVLRDNGKIIGVIGTGFDFDQFLKQSVGIEQEGVRTFFIKKDLSIQLAKDTRMIDYASMTKKNGTHKTINMVFKDPSDIEHIKEEMGSLEHAKSHNSVKTLWVNVEGEKHLLGIAYQRDVGWFSLTLFDTEELTLVNNKNIFILISLFFIVTLVLLGFILKSLVISPIEKLKELMIRVEKGQFDSDLPIVGSGEIAELSERFNGMVKEIQEHNETLEQKIYNHTVDLRASEIKFRALFDFTNDAIMLLDEKRFFDCNKAALDMFGCTTVEELCTADLSPRNQPCGTDSIMLASKHIQTALQTGHDHFEWIHKRVNSSEIFFADVLLSAMVLGDRMVLQAVVRDDTVRKNTEKELRKLSQALEQSRTSVLITDVNNKIEYVNAAFTKATGYSMDEVIGKSPRIFKSDKTPPEIYEEMWACLLQGEAWVGELTNRRKDGIEYIQEIRISPIYQTDQTVSHYLAMNEDITNRKRAEAEIHALAFYDTLTNLPNRRLLFDRLTQAQNMSKRSCLYGAVLFMDLDNFKPLNDTYGHGIGDLLLIQVAQRIRSCVREHDTVARFGGDEFIVLLSELSEDKNGSISHATVIAEKIRHALAHPYFLKILVGTIEEKIVEHHCSASIGCTLFLKDEATQDEILKQADSAMYTAKENGRNKAHFYSSSV